MARTAIILPDLRSGGAERVALALAEDLIDAGHDVDLVLLHGGGELQQFAPRGVSIVDLKASRIRGGFFPLLRYFRRAKPLSTHALMWPVTIISVIAHRMSGNPGRLILSDHTTLSRHLVERGSNYAAFLKWTIRWLYPLADARVMVSKDAAADIARLSKLPESSFKVIYNPLSNRPRGGAPLPDDSWGGFGARILTVGNLKRVKNHLLLLEAFALVLRERDARLAVVGEGELRGDLSRRATELGIADRVLLTGFVADPYPYYESADVFVLSSDYEGYPLVLAEAMTAGLNVVSTDCDSGPREILEGGSYGRLVPVGDAERLARAILDSLDRPIDAALLKQRAQDLSAGSLETYRKLMVEDASGIGTPSVRHGLCSSSLA